MGLPVAAPPVFPSRDAPGSASDSWVQLRATESSTRRDCRARRTAREPGRRRRYDS